MSYILNIHTATEVAIVNLSKDAQTLCTKINTETKQHAAFLHAAIHDLLQQEGILIKRLDAIGITSGPGSYTGMRVGLAAAKGFCFALDIPLITLNTLEVMAGSAAGFVKDRDILYCPMIDARRMEVYTAVYSYTMDEIESPAAKILSENSYVDYLKTPGIIFSGSGSKKFQSFAKLPASHFVDISISSEKLTEFSWNKFQTFDFENIINNQPLYIKEFYTNR